MFADLGNLRKIQIEVHAAVLFSPYKNELLLYNHRPVIYEPFFNSYNCMQLKEKWNIVKPGNILKRFVNTIGSVSDRSSTYFEYR